MMKTVLRFLVGFALIFANVAAEEYYGKRIGALTTITHQVQGEVYASTENTIFIRNFTFDGSGPAAYFWVGKTANVSKDGVIVPDELGRTMKLSSYQNQNVLIKLPNDMKVTDIRWFSVWCTEFQANFGFVKIPTPFDPPKEFNLGRLPPKAHSTSADAVIIKDVRTLVLKNFRYDGSAPDTYFLIGKGRRPHERGIKVPDEKGRLTKIRGYTGEDIRLRLPENAAVTDAEWFAIYCISARENFGHVKIPPRNELNVPADLKTLSSSSALMNCETVFADMMEVSWQVDKNDLFVQLKGRVQPDQYLAFGTSGKPKESAMVGADVTLAFFDPKKQSARVVDYILSSQAQCAVTASSTSGACPDASVGGKDDSKIVSWSYVNGILEVLYRRALITGDASDTPIRNVSVPIAVVAAVGPLNSKGEAAFHNIAYTRRSDSPFIWILNRPISNNCNGIETTSGGSAESDRKGWDNAELRGVTEFRVLIGPAGGNRGYTSITGIQSWGIAYWVNDELIPVIHVKRNTTYTFRIEAGDSTNVEDQARYHPFYITNNKEGGGAQFESDLFTPKHMIYAGVKKVNGKADPSSGAGRYCELEHKTVDQADNVESLAEYRKTLRKVCKPGKAAVFKWTPDVNTPDVVYYQCFTHRNLGWKIIVDERYGASSDSSYVKLSLTFLFIIFSAIFCLN